MTKTKLLGPDGAPLKVNGHAKPRRELAEALAAAEAERKRVQRGSYDAAQDLQDNRNHWASSDTFDADSANSRAVREKLVPRSRYEIANNGYSDGIAQTYATDLVGVGPQLRMQTGSTGFNRLVEQTWFDWCRAIQFRRKLWCLAHAKHSDGEGIGVMRRNPNLKHAVKMDWQLYESEQCQTPLLNPLEIGRIDGIQFDKFGNPVSYDLLQYHPGSVWSFQNKLFKPETIPANLVTHWLRLRRPGQHRGVPEQCSTLNLGAAARRWRESTLAHAELIAKLTVLLKTLMQPADEDADPVTAMSTLELLAGTMLALPNTVEPVQLDAKQPAATYEMFHKTLLNEQARPKNMPYNKAACDSSSYNYASGRLDHQTYYASLDVEREDCNDLVLDPLFAQWFDLAVVTFGWLGGNPAAISDGARAHLWDWPQHQAVDIQAEASANDVKLKNGSTYLAAIYAEQGLDYEDEVQKKADSHGITVEQQKKLDILANIPPRTLPFAAQILGLDQPQQIVEQTKIDNAVEDSQADGTDQKAGWVTLDNGVHVEIGDDGTISSGPDSMRGKTLQEVQRQGKSPAVSVAQRFSSESEADHFGRQHFGDYAKSLSKHQVDAVKNYQLGSDSDINGALREGASASRLPSGDREIAEHLDSIIANAPPLKSPVVVTRGLSRQFDNLKPGDVLKDRGYVSTSLTQHVADSFAEENGAILSITVPAGARAMYLDSIRDIGEQELLIGRGSSLKVHAIDSRVGQQLIHAELAL